MTPDERKRIFSRNLRALIARSGKEQKEVAKDLGYHSNTFNNWCRGIILPNVNKMQAIADYFGVDRNSMMGESDFTINEDEKELIQAYRDAPESRREAVRVLLDITDEEKGNHLYKPF